MIMDERMKDQKFLQLQFCLLLLVCALLPDLGSFIGAPSLDIPALCCQLIGIVGSGLALLAFHKSMGGLPTPFVYIVWAGLLLALLVILPGGSPMVRIYCNHSPIGFFIHGQRLSRSPME